MQRILLALALSFAAVSTATAEPTPAAPARKALSKVEAQRLAAKLANAAIEARSDLKDPAGNKIKGDLTPELFTGDFKHGRWTLQHTAPAGTNAFVSFDAVGEHAKVDVNYSPE